MKSMHRRYRVVFDDSDAEQDRQQIEIMRRSFEDIGKDGTP